MAVVSEGPSPVIGEVGVGTVDYTLTAEMVSINQQGTTPIILTTANNEANPVSWINQTLESGQQKIYRYQVDSNLYAAEVRLLNATGAPYMSLAEDSVGKIPIISDSYGSEEGGTNPESQSYQVLTKIYPSGVHTVTVAANKLSNLDTNATYDLVVIAKEIEADLSFNGGSAARTLADEQQHFYRIDIPESALNSGWKITLETTSGSLSGRVMKDSIPAASQGLALATSRKDTVLTSPYLTAGTWYVALTANGLTDYTISSSLVNAEADLSYSGDSSGEQDVAEKRWHFYRVTIPDGNTGLLHTAVEAINGDPELYIRRDLPPTLDHRHDASNNWSGSIYDYYDTSDGTMYGNWALGDGRLEQQLQTGVWWLAIYGNSTNVRYDLFVNDGNIDSLTDPTYSVVNQVLAEGDARYYSFVMPDVVVGPPASIIESMTINLQQISGDVEVHIRDTIPPGQYSSISDWRNWYHDHSYVYPNPYVTIDDTGDTVISASALKPGRTYYLGVRANSDAVFDLQASFSETNLSLTSILNFDNGSYSGSMAPGEEYLFIVDVPADGSRWKHTSTHSSLVSVYIRQSSLPFASTYDHWYSSGADSSYNRYLLQYYPNNYPWQPGERYFIRVINNESTNQPFSIQMDGRRLSNDDEDADGILDYWEWEYYSGLYYGPTNDTDGDGIFNLDEFNNGTNPTSRPPEVIINSPLDAANFAEVELINLSGVATDYEDGDITANIEWYSNIDGYLGTGSNININLTLGQHVISATVVDTGGDEPQLIPIVTVNVIAANAEEEQIPLPVWAYLAIAFGIFTFTMKASRSFNR